MESWAFTELRILLPLHDKFLILFPKIFTTFLEFYQLFLLLLANMPTLNFTEEKESSGKTTWLAYNKQSCN